MRTRLITVGFFVVQMLVMSGCYDDPVPDPKTVAPALQPRSLLAHADPKKIEVKHKSSPPQPSKPRMTEDTAAYLKKVGDESDQLSRGVSELSSQCTEVGGNIDLLSNDDWKQKAAASCASVLVTGQYMQENFGVPPECRGIQKKISRLGQSSISLAHHFAKAIDNRDGSELTKFTETIDLANQQGSSIAADILKLRSHYAP